MDDAVFDILNALRSRNALDAKQLDAIVRAHSRLAHDGRRRLAKKHLLAHYLMRREEDAEIWRSWKVDDVLHERMMKTLQMKPRRTASGVATITVITKPWPCANNCVYCPDDPTMPKSYLRDEPACQRAERNGFDPYLQVASRLRTLQQMGHATEKIELIVLGGTWMDYPRDYRLWFICELFSALNADETDRAKALALRGPQERDRSGEMTPLHIYKASFDRLERLHEANESARHRVVGLVVETRPDTVTPASLREMRRLGCTKVQLGVQSIDERLLRVNGRRETPEDISHALDLARLFGFKTHTHFMLNLLGATPQTDKADYARFANDAAFVPDEVKLYPCALVAGTQLQREFEQGTWRPYSEAELMDVLCACMRSTPSHMRVSRMIRDISAKDILEGNKKTNLRQMVDERLREREAPIREIRFREIANDSVDASRFSLHEERYETPSTDEVFLSWLSDEGKIAGFLRLSLPKPSAPNDYAELTPLSPYEAMIREVHVYGIAANVGERGDSAQHRGLGRKLVERACEIARDAGYFAVNVISAIGTRQYYRKLGFHDAGLYQNKPLM